MDRMNDFYKCFVPEIAAPRYCFNQPVRNMEDSIILKASDSSLEDTGCKDEPDEVYSDDRRSTLLN